MEHYQNISFELYQSKLKWIESTDKLHSIKDFYDAYRERTAEIDESCRESIENYLITISFFEDKVLFDQIVTDFPFELTDQRLKFLILALDGQNLYSAITLIKKKGNSKIWEYYNFIREFMKSCNDEKNCSISEKKIQNLSKVLMLS